MDLNNFKNRLDLVKDLFYHCSSLSDSIDKEAAEYPDEVPNVLDIIQLERIKERLYALLRFVYTEEIFCYALQEMNNLKTSDEDSKWTFHLERAFVSFSEEHLMNYIEGIITVSRSWEFDDYRARNFQNDLRQKMEMLRDWYK